MAILSVNETTTFRWSFEEDVARYAAAGIPAIGVWRHKLSDCGEAKAIDLLAQHRLKVSHVFWAGGFTGSDGRSFRSSLDDAADAIRSAAALASKTLLIYSGARAGHTHNHARRLFQDALKELLPMASELGVTLAIEPMHPDCASQFTFLFSADEVLRLLDPIGASDVKIVLDTYHLGFSPDLVGHLPQFADRIALVQLGDGKSQPLGEPNRCRLGEGIVPLRKITAALACLGYNGYYDVELIGEGLEALDYPSLLEHAKEAFSRLVPQ